MSTLRIHVAENDGDYVPRSDPWVDFIPPEGEPAPPQDPEQCPVCESMDIHRIPKVRIFILVAVIFGGIVAMDPGTFWPALAIIFMAPFVLHLFVEDWHCRSCGHRWS